MTFMPPEWKHLRGGGGARRRGLLVIPIIYTARTDENVDAYRRMYEKSMIFADSVGMLGEFERLLMKLVR